MECSDQRWLDFRRTEASWVQPASHASRWSTAQYHAAPRVRIRQQLMADGGAEATSAELADHSWRTVTSLKEKAFHVLLGVAGLALLVFSAAILWSAPTELRVAAWGALLTSVGTSAALMVAVSNSVGRRVDNRIALDREQRQREETAEREAAQRRESERQELRAAITRAKLVHFSARPAEQSVPSERSARRAVQVTLANHGEHAVTVTNLWFTASLATGADDPVREGHFLLRPSQTSMGKLVFNWLSPGPVLERTKRGKVFDDGRFLKPVLPAAARLTFQVDVPTQIDPATVGLVLEYDDVFGQEWECDPRREPRIRIEFDETGKYPWFRPVLQGSQQDFTYEDDGPSA